MSAAGRNVGIFGAHGAKAGQSPTFCRRAAGREEANSVQNQCRDAIRRKRCYERMAGLNERVARLARSRFRDHSFAA